MRFYRAIFLSLLVLGLAACSTTPQLKQLEQGPSTNYRQELNQQAVAFWQPSVGEPWHYQIGSPVSQSDQFDDNINIYSIDVFDNEPANITFLKNRGIKVICYINVGAWEVWRDDAGQFPDSVILGNYDNWDGERWLDIRPPEKLDNPADGWQLRQIMEARFDEAALRGCDAVEPDNLDAWNPLINLNNGQPREFEISYQDQLDYNIYLANIAHERGLSIGLKSNVEQAADLIDYYDWALNEECTLIPYPDQSGRNECQFYQDTFIAQNKAVFWVEYLENGSRLEEFCPQSGETLGLSFMLSDVLLRGDVTTAQRCPDTSPPPPPPPSSDNVLINASFQNGLSSWIVGNCGSGSVTVNGQNELRLTSGEACIGQVVSASESVPYTFSCSAKNLNSGYSEISMYIEGSGGTLLASDSLVVANSAFASKALTVNAPAGTETILVAAYTFDGDMSMDSCSLVAGDITNPPPPPPPSDSLLVNPSFDNLEGWENCNNPDSYSIAGGNLNLSAGACVYQTIDASVATEYTLTCTGDVADSSWSTFILSALDSNWGVISQVYEPLEVTNGTKSIVLTAPSGTEYMAVSFYNEGNATYQECSID